MKPQTGDFESIVLHQLISGTNDTRSAFYTHSFLEDVYGRDAIEGAVNSAKNAAINAVTNEIGLTKVRLDTGITINPDLFRNLLNTDEDSYSSQLSNEKDIYTGRLITFLEGPYKESNLSNSGVHRR